MKFRLGLAMTLCMTLGMTNIAVMAEENSSGNNVSTSSSQSTTESSGQSLESSASSESSNSESSNSESSNSESSSSVNASSEGSSSEGSSSESSGSEISEGGSTTVENVSNNESATMENHSGSENASSVEESNAQEADGDSQENVKEKVDESQTEVGVEQGESTDVDEKSDTETVDIVDTAVEIVELPDEEVPLADGLIQEEITEEVVEYIEEQQEATLVITHTLKFDVGEGSCQEVITGLKAGETVSLGAYIHIDEEIEVCNVSESIVLNAGENTTEIHYQFIKKIVEQDDDTEEVLEGDDCR